MARCGHRQNLQSVLRIVVSIFAPFPFCLLPHTRHHSMQKIASFCRILSPGFLAGKWGPWPYWGLLSSRSPMDGEPPFQILDPPLCDAQNAVPIVLLMLNNIVLAQIRCQPALMKVNH